jgi:hypothetical protein
VLFDNVSINVDTMQAIRCLHHNRYEDNKRLCVHGIHAAWVLILFKVLSSAVSSFFVFLSSVNAGRVPCATNHGDVFKTFFFGGA